MQVRYVPEEPSISRLAFGEVDEWEPSKTPLVGYGMPALLGLFALCCLAMVPLLWRGNTIDWDSQTKRFRIKRYGAEKNS